MEWISILLKNWKVTLAGLLVLSSLTMGVVIKMQHDKIIILKLENKKMSQDIDIQNREVKHLKELGDEMQKRVDDVSKVNRELYDRLNKKIINVKTKDIKTVQDFQSNWNEIIK